ncbi:MAG: hypothetical protein DSY50_08065 [Desulfobulbus sp.]|nr:MAG: hypothetical protein DSY50_08065 [Desulfobulbus sp.]
MALPEVGDILDIFVLRSLLHDGPMASLFRAEDLLTRQNVVLKIPGSDILNHPVLLYHFQNEDRIGRLLDHPGIVRFIHRQRSRQYIIMEFLEGRDLRSFIRSRKRLPLDKALQCVDQLCGIIKYMHSQGVCHLDLKPENIICDKESRMKIIDFGLASCAHFPDLLAKDLAAPLGTPWYIAPEQLQGERGDPRCDIYTLGMLLYEMLTGHLPWPRTSSLRVARRRLHYEPTPPRYFNPEIPPQIQTIILRAIARLPDNRYTDASSLQQDLKQWWTLPVTQSGSVAGKHPFWQRIWPKRFSHSGSRRARVVSRDKKKQIIGAIVDAPGCDFMLAEVKKQALVRSADITLVHIIEEDDDSHVRRYGITVEGEKLMYRLEGAVQLLRRCSLDPGIRLLRGEVVEELRELCTGNNVELLVVAGSRKEDSLFSADSVCKRLRRDCPSEVIVAEEKPFSPLVELSSRMPDELSADQVMSCDIFLVDLWYDQLRYYSESIYKKILQVSVNGPVDAEKSILEQFFHSLAPHEQWAQVSALLQPSHSRFLRFSEQIGHLKDCDPVSLKHLYTDELLPLSCRLKIALAEVSGMLRRRVDTHLPTVPFLVDSSCPVNIPALSCYGPLLRTLDLGRDLNMLIKQQSGKRDSGCEENN